QGRAEQWRYEVHPLGGHVGSLPIPAGDLAVQCHEEFAHQQQPGYQWHETEAHGVVQDLRHGAAPSLANRGVGSAAAWCRERIASSPNALPLGIRMCTAESAAIML